MTFGTGRCFWLHTSSSGGNKRKLSNELPPCFDRCFVRACSAINVNTDLQVAMAKATWAFVESGEAKKGKNYDPRKLLKPGFDAIVARAKELIVDFGSDGKGWA